MFEKFIEHELRNSHYFDVFLYTFFITSFLFSIALYFEIGFLAYLLLITLAIGYPLGSYIKHQDSEELKKRHNEEFLLFRHFQELTSIFIIFIALTLGFFVALSYASVVPTYIQDLSIGTTGILQDDISVLSALMSNIGVFFLIFVLCFISISAIMFVLTWQALLLSTTMHSMTTFSNTFSYFIFSLSYSLLEIGGYTLAGFAGILLSLRFDIHKKKFTSKLDAQLLKDVLTLLLLGFSLVALATALKML